MHNRSPAATSAPQLAAGLAETILGTIDALVVVLDPQGRVVQFNRACEQLTGLDAARVTGELLWPLVLEPAEVPGVTQAFEALRAGDFPSRHENHWRAEDGELRLITWSNTAVLDTQGRVALVIGTGVDVTAERAAQRASQEHAERFQALFDQSADGLVLLDPHDPEVPWRIVDCNAAFCRMNGYARADLIDQSIDLLHPTPLMAERGPELLAWIREEQPVHGEGLHLHRSGREFPVESASSLVTVGGQELVLGQDRDISERKRAESRMKELAAQLTYETQHDALTGLPNRTLLLDRLQVELRRVTRQQTTVAVVFVDLDGFKRVNDTLGHAAGDELLRQVAARLQECLRPSDTVARLGGDEFVAVVPDLRGPEDAERVARRLQQAISPPLLLAGQAMTVQASLGVALHPPHSSLPANLLRQADMAMYQAKRAGKSGLLFFRPDMDAAAHRQLNIELSLRRALESGGLHLHYQPQVDARTGALRGFEALVRWTDEQLGSVPPSRFIPVAEDAGLIGVLGQWVLNEACRQSAEWGLNVPVAVNVSTVELDQGDYCQEVVAALERHGLSSAHLKLELAERLSAWDVQRAAQQLARLHALGVQVSLDDFGTGQSSVSTLLKLSLSELKLDGSLVRGVAESVTEQRVISALIGLARSLNLTVIAEGVETEGQLHTLRALGCETVQGYLTGRPGPAAHWAEVLRAQAAPLGAG